MWWEFAFSPKSFLPLFSFCFGVAGSDVVRFHTLRSRIVGGVWIKGGSEIFEKSNKRVGLNKRGVWNYILYWFRKQNLHQQLSKIQTKTIKHSQTKFEYSKTKIDRFKEIKPNLHFSSKTENWKINKRGVLIRTGGSAKFSKINNWMGTTIRDLRVRFW